MTDWSKFTPVAESSGDAVDWSQFAPAAPEAGAGRGFVNPDAKFRAGQIAAMDDETDPSNPNYLPITSNAQRALQTDARGDMDAKRTKGKGRVLDADIPAATVGSVVQDIGAGALQIGPTALKGVGDIARMATGDTVGKGLSDAMESGNKAIQEVVGSDRAAAQKKRFEQDMQDKALNPADVIVGNPGSLADQVLPTVGSMALPVGVSAAAGGLARAGNAARLAAAIDPATVAARAATASAAAVIATTAAQNAADTYSNIIDKGGSQEDAYRGAVIAGSTAALVGKATGGGAEGALARVVGGKSIARGAIEAPKAMAKEAGQEVGEQLGQSFGELTGTGEMFDANKFGKEVAVAGTLGAVVGGGANAATQLAGSVSERLAAREKQFSEKYPAAGQPAAAPAAEPKLDPVAEIAKAQTVDEAIAAATRATQSSTAVDNIAEILKQNQPSGLINSAPAATENVAGLSPDVAQTTQAITDLEAANVSPPAAVQPLDSGAAGSGVPGAADSMGVQPGAAAVGDVPLVDVSRGGTAENGTQPVEPGSVPNRADAGFIPLEPGTPLDAVGTNVQNPSPRVEPATQAEPAQAPEARAVAGSPAAAAGTATGDAAVQAAGLSARQVAIASEKARIEAKRVERAAAKAQASAAPPGLSVGMMPNTAEPVTVKNGVVYIGKYPANNFDTGADVMVDVNATLEQIRDALVQSGALGKKARVFGVPNKAPAIDGRAIPATDFIATETPNAAQQRADFAASEKTRKVPGNAARTRASAENPFKAFLGKHGISNSLAAEFAPGRKERQAAMVQGYGPMFRKSGPQLDALAARAVEEGFLLEPDEAKLQALIADVLRGKRVIPQYAQGVAEDEGMARAARAADPEQQDAEAQNAEVEAENKAERDAIQAVADLPDAALEFLAGNDVVLTASNNVSEAEFLRALGATEQEIEDATAKQSEGARQGDQGRAGVEETAASAAQGNPQGRDSQAGNAEGLTSPTPADVLDQQDRRDNAEALDERQQIDREAGGQTLTSQTAPEQRTDTSGDMFAAESDAATQSELGNLSRAQQAAGEFFSDATPAAHRAEADRISKVAAGLTKLPDIKRRYEAMAESHRLAADRKEQGGGMLFSRAAKATDILDAADITGKDRLEALRDVRAGLITPDELEAAYPAKVDQTQTENFKRWSNNAPVVSSADAMTYPFKTGEKVVLEAYHGTARPDRVGTVFNKKRATSGPMAYFTSEPELASGYAQGKADTSLNNEDQAYETWFKFKPQGQRTASDIVRAWYSLSAEEKDTVARLAPRVMFGEEQEADGGNTIVLGPEDHDSGTGSYDYNLGATKTTYDRRGNPLKALVEDWLNSGNLFNDELRFMQVLKLAGFPVKDVTYDSPQDTFPFVYKAFVAMQRPLVVTDMPPSLMAALDEAAKRDRSRAQQSGADMWDKNTRTVKEWVANLKDPANGTASYVWTSIPDKVTAVFKAQGYDGIIDWSGKGGGHRHPVYIPFEETQVKSAIGNSGKFDPLKKNILFSRGTQTEEANALEAISRTDELFALPKSEATTVEEIAAENDPAIKVKKTRDATGRTDYKITLPNGKIASLIVRRFNPYATPEVPTVYGYDMRDGEMENLVLERPGTNPDDVGAVDDVWIDASSLDSGGFGAVLYNIAATYAHNTGRKFIGDPAGLSDDALRRRTEQMLSSALKFGTTEHLAPHPRQVRGDRSLGIPPLDWTYGDDLGNIRALAETSLANYSNVNPVTFEPSTGRYLDSEGVELDADAIRQIAEVGPGREAGAGLTTLKRNAVLAALVREEGSAGGSRGQRDGLLGRLVDVAGQSSASTRGIFYSEGSTPAVRNPSTVERVQAAVAELIGGKQLPNGLGRVIVATSADVKSHWLPLMGKNAQLGSEGEAGVAQAFFEPATKSVVLIADNIPAGDEMAVAAHELMHKHGQAVLGADGWNKLHDTINGWANAPEDSDERAVYNYARSRVEAVGMELSSQEMFPYAVEAAIKMGVKPSLIAKKGTVARWLGSVKYAMQQAWAKITNSPSSFNSQDLVDLAFGIAQMENPESAAAIEGALESASAISPGNEFWSKIESGENFTQKELTDAYSIGRRGTARTGQPVRKKESYSPSEAAGEAFVWQGEIAGFSGYRTYQAEVGPGQFLVEVAPEEVYAKHPDDASILGYLFTALDDGKYKLDLIDPLPGTKGFEALEKIGRVEETGQANNGDLYYRAKLDDRYSTSRMLLQEAVRRLALNIGKTPTIVETGRETGARAGDTTPRDFSADTIAAKFSRTTTQTGTPAAFDDTLETDGWSMPEPTRADKVIYNLQDGRIDLKRVQEAIKEAGAEIAEKFDARQAETLYPGRVARRAETFLNIEVKPLLQDMALNKIDMAELGDYLIARHAPERNAQVAKVNPDLPDGGAGRNSQGVLMTDDAAAEYLAAIPAAKLAKLTTLARKVDAITAGTRALLVGEGLEKQETVDAWTKAYKNYVPLFKDEAEHAHPQGRGFTVKGSASKRSTGSTKEVTNVLAHVLMQRETAITRAEKNRVGLSLYGLALSNPNADFWTTIKPNMSNEQIMAELQAMGVDPLMAGVGMASAPTVRTVDPLTDKVVDRPNPMYKNLPGAITLRVNGEDRVLLLNQDNERAVRMAMNLKNLDGVTQLELAGSIIGKATRWIASVNTQYNPAFGLVNVTRDTLGGIVNLTNTPLRKQKIKVLANVPAALKGIARDLRGDTRTEWSDLFNQFQDDGGQTGFKEMFRTADDRAKAIEKEITAAGKSGMAPGKMAHAVLDLLDDFNTALENSVRLSAYKAALDQGMSRPAAAKLARELTVDFNRKGRAGREIGPLYAFFNASVQGTARTLETLAGPAGVKIIAGGMALGSLQALMLAFAGFDEDEPPEFIKSRALIIPIGGDKRYIAIPYPLGLHVIPNTGRVLTELTINGGKDVGKRSVEAIGEIAGAFNPMGGGNIFTTDGALRTLAPTIVDPLIELAANKNFAGFEIEKKPFREEGDNRPGFQRARESTQRSATGQVYLGISKAVNGMTGGNDFEAGAASPTPERVRYLAHTVGGGVLRELEKSINTSMGLLNDDEVTARGIPVIGRFYGEIDSDQSERSRYFESAKTIKKFETSRKAADKAGATEIADKLIQQHPELEMARNLNNVQERISKLNKKAAETVNNREELKRIDEDRFAEMKGLNDELKKMERAGREPTIAERLRGEKD